MKQNILRLTALALLSFTILSGEFGIVKSAAEDGKTEYLYAQPFLGGDGSEMNFSWYSDSSAGGNIQITQRGDEDFSEAKTISASETGTAQKEGYYYFHASATELNEGMEYIYRVGSEGNWSESYALEVKDTSEGFDFLVAGDAQLGSNAEDISGATDGAAWNQTLLNATDKFPSASFLLHLGDEVELNYNPDASLLPIVESEFHYFYSPSPMRSLPFIGVMGNHDRERTNWSEHHNPANVSEQGGYSAAGNKSGDFYSVYGNTLFIMLNSNNESVSEHDSFMRTTTRRVEKNYGDKITWTVVAFHHSIFSTGKHYADENTLTFRNSMVTVLEKYDVDMVLMGHDHVYVRTKMMDKLIPSTEFGDQYAVTPNKEIAYFTFNSSSGSKYYEIKDPEAAFSAKMIQDERPTIGRVFINGSILKVGVYYADDMSLMDEYTIYNTDPAGKKPVLSFPGNTEIEKGSDFDDFAGVSAFDAIEGDLTDRIQTSGSVNVNQAGSYTLVYTVINTYGESASAQRTVTVKEQAASSEGNSSSESSQLPDSSSKGDSTLSDKGEKGCGSIVYTGVSLAVLAVAAGIFYLKKRGIQDEK
mgnify:FL=1